MSSNPRSTEVVIDLVKAEVKHRASLIKSDKEVAPYLAYAAKAEALARAGHLFTTGPNIDECKLKLKVLAAYASAKTSGSYMKKHELAKKGELKEVEKLLRDSEKWNKIQDAVYKLTDYITRHEARGEDDATMIYRSDLSIPDLKKSIQSHPRIAPSVNLHANSRRPGAASEFGRRGRNPNRPNAEERYVNGLYANMPRGGLRTPEVNVQQPEDVVKGLGFSPQDESAWTVKVRGWLNEAKSHVGLRKALYASLTLEKSLPLNVRAELARRTDILFKSRNRGAGDFMVKSIGGKPTLVKAQPQVQPTGRQSSRGKPVPPGGRNPPPKNGKGKPPPPTRNGKGAAPGDDDRVKVHPPGKSSVTDADTGNAPPAPGDEGKDDNGYANGGNHDRDSFAAPNLDAAGLEEGPQDTQVITSEIEKLHKQLHEMHNKMEHTPGEVHLHNEIVAKMREVYADPTAEGLSEVRHKLHHFVELVQGEEEGAGDMDDDEGEPGGPPGGFPPKKEATVDGPPRKAGGPPPGKPGKPERV